MYNFEAENKFFQNLDHFRASKIFFQLDIFKETIKIKGDICEFGVFKGNSLNRLIIFRDFYSPKKKINAFDTFKLIKLKKKNIDYQQYKDFLKVSKNFQPTAEQLRKQLKSKNMFSNINLVKGDVTKTLIKQNIKKISFVLLDLDLYKPTQYVLNNTWSKLSKNGIILLDNYNVFKGETKAVNEFVKMRKISIYKKKLKRTFYYLKK